MMIYIWLSVIVLSVIVEAVTAEVVSIWFVPAAIVGLILEFCGVGDIWQIAAFLITSAIGLALARTILKRFIQKNGHVPTNVTDLVIGTEAVVTEKIDNLAETGEVRTGGKSWTARTESGNTVEVGATVKVLRISGVKLICSDGNED